MFCVGWILFCCPVRFLYLPWTASAAVIPVDFFLRNKQQNTNEAQYFRRVFRSETQKDDRREKQGPFCTKIHSVPTLSLVSLWGENDSFSIVLSWILLLYWFLLLSKIVFDLICYVLNKILRHRCTTWTESRVRGTQVTYGFCGKYAPQKKWVQRIEGLNDWGKNDFESFTQARL